MVSLFYVKISEEIKIMEKDRRKCYKNNQA